MICFLKLQNCGAKSGFLVRNNIFLLKYYMIRVNTKKFVHYDSISNDTAHKIVKKPILKDNISFFCNWQSICLFESSYSTPTS